MELVPNQKVLSEENKDALEDADAFLASLFDDDEFANSIDEEKINEILQPAQQLPVENITAMIDPVDDMENIELKITIPLKVVEEGEVEKLIEYYDQQNRRP